MTRGRGVGWWRAVGPLCGALAVAGLWHTTRAGVRALQVDVSAAAAQGAAGFFSLVVPADTAGNYDGTRLLSSAALLEASEFWRLGFQVARGATPLLPDPSHGAPPSVDAAEGVRAGAARAVGARPDGGLAVFVPLFDRDLWAVRGWVEVWDALPPGGAPVVGWLLTALVLVALVRTARLTTPSATSRGRRMAAAVPIAAMLGLAAASVISLRSTAARATDLSLIRARRLAEVASVSRRLSVADLERLAPGMDIEGADSLDLGRSVRRLTVDGADESVVAGVMSGGRPFRVSIVPFESRLSGVWAALAGWVLLLVAGVGFSGWATGAVGERAHF
ncbi:MAG TPA: hypothetical protein VGR60_01885, partial [Gemmatimonadales bacterium]|nr:hypothetical protein [Gemmatimonadales bacterium]